MDDDTLAKQAHTLDWTIKLYQASEEALLFFASVAPKHGTPQEYRLHLAYLAKLLSDKLGPAQAYEALRFAKAFIGSQDAVTQANATLERELKKRMN